MQNSRERKSRSFLERESENFILFFIFLSLVFKAKLLFKLKIKASQEKQACRKRFFKICFSCKKYK